MDVVEEVEEESMYELKYITNDRQKLDKLYVDNLIADINITEDIPIIIEEDFLSNSIIIFKTALMSTIEKLYDTIDFLKNN